MWFENIGNLLLRSLLLKIILFLELSEPVIAGTLLVPSVKWQSFSFRPEKDEPTPNYYGYGAGLNLGYSFAQVVDLAAYVGYTPAQQKHAGILKESAALVCYGGELAFRIVKAIYFAMRGGTYNYNLVNTTYGNEVDGFWSGAGGGVSFGAFFEINKSNFWQLSLDVASMQLRQTNVKVGQEPPNKRQIDSFSVTLSYVFNQKDSLLAGGGILGDFMNSLGF